TTREDSMYVEWGFSIPQQSLAAARRKPSRSLTERWKSLTHRTMSLRWIPVGGGAKQRICWKNTNNRLCHIAQLSPPCSPTNGGRYTNGTTTTIMVFPSTMIMSYSDG